MKGHSKLFQSTQICIEMSINKQMVNIDMFTSSKERNQVIDTFQSL